MGSVVAPVPPSDSNVVKNTRLTVSDQHTPPNNTTNRHANPANVETSGNITFVQQWLLVKMSTQLTNSTHHLRQGEFGEAQRTLDGEYQTYLSKYSELAAETPTSQDDRLAQAFAVLEAGQISYTKSVRMYVDDYQSFREAMADGNKTRARMIARHLENQTTQLNRTGTSLAHRYVNVSNVTTRDLNTSRETILAITHNISRRQAVVRKTLFNKTKINVTVYPSRISHRQPGTIRGRLSTINESPIANQRIRLRIAGKLVHTQTNEMGHFSVLYRPTTVTAGQQTITIQYLPDDSSKYLPSASSFNTTINRVRPEITINHRPSEVGYDDELIVWGSVTAENIGAANVPITVAINNQTMAHGQTNPRGRYELNISIPGSIPDGRQTLVTQLAMQDRALIGVETKSTVNISRTPTRITLSVRKVSWSNTSLKGRLRTADNVPINDARIRISGNRTNPITLQTNRTGHFNGNVTYLQEDSHSDRTAIIIAMYNSTNSNLGVAKTTTTIQVPPNPRGSNEGLTSQLIQRLSKMSSETGFLVVLASLISLFAGMIFRYRYQKGLSRSTDNTLTDLSRGDQKESEQIYSNLDQHIDTDTRLSDARSYLNEGNYDRTVELSYGLVRRLFADEVQRSEFRTHWEFYTTCRDNGFDQAGLKSLRRITEIYERAAFTPNSVSRTEAESALDHASALISGKM